MFDLTKKFLAPMISLFLLAIGASIFTTGQSIWLHHNNYSTLLIGITTTAYYAGFVYAAFRSEKLIIRVSHIRAYALFAALLCAFIIVQGVWKNAYAWILIRLLAGYCTAGLFVVIESWLLSKSTNEIRGLTLALYMIFFYAAQALGQFFLNLGVKDILRLFAIAGLFTSLSIVPLAMTKLMQPKIEHPSALSTLKLIKLSPSGVMGCFISGLLLGPIYGLFPIYLSSINKSTDFIALGMFIIILGGMFFQIPFGKLSDRTDRRKIIALAFAILLIAGTAIITLTDTKTIKYAIYFIFGGAAFAIYPLSMSYAVDVLDVDDMVSAAQGLVLANSMGMVLGPIIAALAIKYISLSKGLIIYFMIIAFSMLLFFIWRILVSEKVATEEQQEFIAVARPTPVSIEIDPRIENE